MRSDIKRKNRFRPTCTRCRKRSVDYTMYDRRYLCLECYIIVLRFKKKELKERDIEYYRMLRLSLGLPHLHKDSAQYLHKDSVLYQTDT